MSIQAGIWNFDGEPVDEQFLACVSHATAQHGPDGEASHIDGPLGMLYRPFHTTQESCLECQPYASLRKNVITWDGRLDNREELIPQLDEYLTGDHTDVGIVASAFDRWGTDCFPKLLGDWALVIWNPCQQILILAKDYIGVRHLYYRQTPKHIVWCTTLEPIVRLASGPLPINDEFVGGYLASFPAAHVTPYVGIDSVPPCSYVTIKAGTQRKQIYWQFDPGNKIRCRSDSEYEEHFCHVFRESVRRRLRSPAPIISELSGGMDSSSIVCLADVLIAEGEAETPRLDTMSYYDDEEPNWNERPYFQRVEEKRGRTGCHISIVQHDPFVDLPDDYYVVVPGVSQGSLFFENQCVNYMHEQGSRVLLSGIGGDEVMGGVPTPIPELADLLSQFYLIELAAKLKLWSLARKQPWTRLLIKSLSMALARGTHHDSALSKLKEIPWLDKHFLRGYKKALQPNSHALPAHGCLPSQRAFLRTLAALTNQIASAKPPLVETRDIRYPYLDRRLCEFLFSIPREQIVRPGQRRSLMRRALAGIVPDEILQRKRKAFVVRRAMTMYDESWPKLQDCFRNSRSRDLRYIDESKFLQTLAATIRGQLSNLIQLNRAIALELWLKRLAAQKRSLLWHPEIDGKKIETRHIINPVGASRRS
jgi:asparagine synthase (glutamine-hydrolysing)